MNVRFFFFLPFFSLLILHSLYSQSEEETLLLRRIAKLFADNDLVFAEQHAHSFLEKYPDSPFIDQVHANLGNLAFLKKEWQQAVSHYKKLTTPHWIRKTFLQCGLALYHAQRYRQLKQTLLSLSSALPQEETFLIDYNDDDLFSLSFPKKTTFSIQQQHTLRFLFAECLYHLTPQSYSRSLPDLFLSLLNTPYKSIATARLIDLYQSLKQPSQLAHFYYTLSQEEKDDEKRELYRLKQAMTLQSVDELAAINAFLPLLHTSTKHASTIASRLTFLLFKHQRLQELYQKRETIIALLEEKDHSIPIDFCIGLAAFSEQNYEETFFYLEPCLPSDQLNDLQKKKALLALIIAGYKSENLQKVITFTEKMIQTYPQSSNSLLALFYRAAAYHHRDQLENSKMDLEQILRSAHFDTFEHKEEILWEYLGLLVKMEQWTASREFLLHFLPQHLASPRFKQALFLFAHSAIQTNRITEKSSDDEETKKNLMRVIEDLKTLLHLSEQTDSPSHFPEWKKTVVFYLVQCLYQIQQYQQVIDVLEQTFLKTTTFSPEVYFFLSASHYHLSNYYKVINFGEKYFESVKDNRDQLIQLHLFLFSAYFKCAEQLENTTLHQKEKRSLFEKGAMHLKRLWLDQHYPIKTKYQRWLLQFFYDSIQKEQQKKWQKNASKKRASMSSTDQFSTSITLYRKFLEETFPKKNASLSEKYPYIFQLGQLFAWNGERKKQIALLESFKEELNQASAPLLPHLYITLSQAYRNQHFFDQSLALCDAILSSSLFDRFTLNKAKIERARTLFSSVLTEEKKFLSEQDQRIVEALGILNTLKQHKSLTEEPLHLEAALDYVSFSSLLAPLREQPAISLQLLQQVKQHFSTQDDIHSRDYHTLRLEYPEKDRIYQLFLLFIDAEIERLSALLANQRGKLREAKRKKQLANQLFEKLRQQTDLPEYLSQRLQENTQQMTLIKNNF